jgi:hypothetical protein
MCGWDPFLAAELLGFSVRNLMARLRSLKEFSSELIKGETRLLQVTRLWKGFGEDWAFCEKNIGNHRT